MEAPGTAARRLRREADRVLNSTGLLDVLADHGVVTATGSYAYDLMTWRDLDFCLEVERPDPALAFRLGEKLAALPGVGSMVFRNEFELRTEGNPLAMFWCLDLRDGPGNAWKIDVLISTRDEIVRVLEPGRRLLEELTEAGRTRILEIKAELTKDPAYGREIRSTDIYEAVLRKGVRSVEEFRARS